MSIASALLANHVAWQNVRTTIINILESKGVDVNPTWTTGQLIPLLYTMCGTDEDIQFIVVSNILVPNLVV